MATRCWRPSCANGRPPAAIPTTARGRPWCRPVASTRTTPSIEAAAHVIESPIEPTLELAALREQAAHCRQCPLGALATQTVWGEGAARARLMIVGEQPGDREDLVGKPFVGPAGHLLDKAIE